MKRLIPWNRLDPDERAGAPVLVRELGVWRAVKTGKKVRERLRAGEPFAHLAPPSDRADELSRGQIGRAIVLYRVLEERVGRARAMDVTEKVVAEAACRFLGQQLGSLSRVTVEAVPEQSRRTWIEEKGARFFNATIAWDRVDTDGVDFTVTACRFPALCREAGVPELAPIFCAGDAAYFGSVEPNVTLERPHTIASGAATCCFRLRYASGA